jgi:hypothetical protein
VLPSSPCEGATKAVLGKTTCEPIGDCDAPLPAAAIVVDPAGPIDATHTRTIGAALSVAAPGAVVAVAPGTYAESLVVRRDVTIVGKCARDVIVSAADTTTPGVDVEESVLTISGITLTGHLHGASIGSRSRVHLQDVLVDGAHEVGIAADGEGTTVDLQGVVVRGTNASAGGVLGRGIDIGAVTLTMTSSSIESSADAGLFTRGGAISISDSVIVGSGGRGVHLAFGATLDALHVAIVEGTEIGVYAVNALTRAHLEESTIERTRAGGGDLFGRGIMVASGATLALRSSAVRASQLTGVLVSDGNATIDQSVVEGVEPDPNGDGGSALVALSKATVSASGTAFVGASGIGVLADASDVRLLGSAIIDTRAFGALASAGARLTLDHSAIDRTRVAGVLAMGQATEATLTHAYVGTVRAAPDGRFGHGLVATDGARADAIVSAIRRCDRAGLFFASARGLVDRSIVSENAVGAHTQDGTALVQSTDTLAPPNPDELRITPATSLVANGVVSDAAELEVPSASAAGND